MAKKRGNNEGSISRRRDGRWMAQVTIGRDPQTGKLKRATYYGTTRQAVATKLTQALRELGQGTFVAPHRLTLGAWLDTWLMDYKRPAVRAITFDDYARVIRKHLTPDLGHLALRDVRPEHVQRCYNGLSARGLSARMVRHVHMVLTGALKQAEKNGLVLRNVARLAELPRVVTPEMQTLTLAQVRGTLGQLPVAVVLALTTGLRRGELLALQWGDIDLARQVLHVRRTMVRAHGQVGARSRLVIEEPKTAQSRRQVPLSEVCMQALRRHKARQAAEKLLLGQAYDDYGLVLCQAAGRPIDPRHFNRQFTRALKEAGLPHIRLHDSRHTFATLLLEQGVSPKTVQVLLGHASAQTTLDIYTHASLELEHQAVKRLDAALGDGGN